MGTIQAQKNTCAHNDCGNSSNFCLISSQNPTTYGNIYTEQFRFEIRTEAHLGVYGTCRLILSEFK